MQLFKQKILKAVKETSLKTFTDLGNYAQSYITEEKRDYPRTTYRQYGVGVTGQVAKSPRDMVDSGETRDSFDIQVKESANELIVRCTWNTPQAVIQYMGTDKIPAYPFVHFAIATFDEKTFSKYWSQL